MRMKPEELENSDLWERVPDEEIPKPVVYNNKKTGNKVYIVPDRRRGRCVLDRYAVLRDVGTKLQWGRRETNKLFRIDDNVLKAIAGIVIHATNPAVTAVLEFAGAGKVAKKIAEFVAGIGGKIDKTGLPALLKQIGKGEHLVLHEAMKKALADGVLTVDEWKAVEALADSLQ